jgi:competence protein ComEA
MLKLRFLMLIITLLTSITTFAESKLVTVDINTANAEELALVLIGVGEKKAQAIVDYREQNGYFGSADELDKVKGIGPKTIEKNRDKIVVSAPPATPETQTPVTEPPATEPSTPPKTETLPAKAPPEAVQ